MMHIKLILLYFTVAIYVVTRHIKGMQKLISLAKNQGYLRPLALSDHILPVSLKLLMAEWNPLAYGVECRCSSCAIHAQEFYLGFSIHL
jgi:hypothetical protein